MYGFWKTFFLKLLFSLVMVAGGFALFIGALGTFNPGFQREVPGGIYFLVIGLGLMVGSWAVMRVVFPPHSKSGCQIKGGGKG